MHLSDILGESHYALLLLLLLVLVLVLGSRTGRHAIIQFDETSDCFVVCFPTLFLHYNYDIRFVVVLSYL